ncbi:MAG: site-specific integrase [Planctomycetaceae bacterium]|nr:site-specific integrase [Planctomycetaceae bacterium]
MASVRKDNRSGRYLVCFRYLGCQYQRSLKTTCKKVAQATASRVDDTIRLIEQGRIVIPLKIDPADFILSDGRLTVPERAEATIRLGRLFSAYQASLPEGAKEPRTLSGEALHIKHLTRHLGRNRIVQTIGLADVQKYVAKRSRDTYRGKVITVDTIKKELSTLRLVWNWAVAEGRLSNPCPTKGVKYPKRDAKPPFMTADEIEKIIGRGGLSDSEQKELWDSLFLSALEVEDLLNEVLLKAHQPFVYPLFLFAAHTGARRSELLRSRIEDFRFDLGTVHIREKKRSRQQSTTYRRVPLSKRLQDGMREWFEKHPGGQHTITASTVPLSPSDATNWFRSTIKNTKWAGKLKGFHAVRHSFASNAAAVGVEQGMIDTWMGHQTEEMRNRYRHLFPKQQQSAIDRIFADHDAA